MNLKKRLLACIILMILLAAICLIGYLQNNTIPVMGEIFEEAGQKKIALTFDDGPHPYYTKQLLDGLAKRGVHVTFFVTGEHAELHPDIIKRMQEEGD